MTDNTTTDETTEVVKDPAMALARAAGASIARTLYISGVTVPKSPEDGGEAVNTSALSKEDFAGKRKEYQNLAKRILKKLSKEGYTLSKTGAVQEDGDDEE